MFQIDNKIVSEEILEKEFVCNLSACKGQCCVEGDAGAPLTKDETMVLEQIYDRVEPYMTPEGKASVEEQGKWIVGTDGDWETPLVDGGACAYVYYEGEQIRCAIEKAFLEEKIDFKKPISCHLYPIRVREFSEFSSVNYHRWHICSDACVLGKELEVPVYQFLKEPLVRKFGQAFYDELELVATEWKKEKQ